MVSLFALIITAIGFIIAFVSEERKWIGATMMGFGMFLVCVASFYDASFIIATIALMLMLGNFMSAYAKYHSNKKNK